MASNSLANHLNEAPSGSVAGIQTILWRRCDTPGHEFASLHSIDRHWHLSGTAAFLAEQQACCLDYSITCDGQWQTTSSRVGGWVGKKAIEIDLAVDSGQHWFLNGKERAKVAGCIDLDLNFSPSTNLLPIRRLNLMIGEEALVRAAWLRFPSFELEPLDQLYRRLDATTYVYESAGGKFRASLEVTEVGFVKNYADIWQMESCS